MGSLAGRPEPVQRISTATAMATARDGTAGPAREAGAGPAAMALQIRNNMTENPCEGEYYLPTA